MGRRTTIALGALALVVVAVASIAAGRSDDGAHEPPRPASTSTSTSTSTPTPTPEDLVDWAARTVRLDDRRWTVQFCEGEGPFVCFSDADGDGGSVELSTWPADELDVVADALAGGATDAEALDAFVADFHRGFDADRREGCGADVEVVPEGPVPARVGHRTGVRYGFRVLRGGTAIEHVVGHAVIDGGSLHLLNASGLAADGCLAREGEFDLTAFDAHTVEVVSRLAAASVLPSDGSGADR